MSAVPHIHYCGGYKYQLTRPYRIKLPVKGLSLVHPYFDLAPDGWLSIRAGYAWDGPSGPTIDTKSFMRGSLVHDVLYQAMRDELLARTWRPMADRILRDLCIEDGMWRWRANLVYRAVRRFAGPAAHPDHRRRELVAP